MTKKRAGGTVGARTDTPTARIVPVGLLALLAVAGFDLLLHAGVLYPLYGEPTPFLLSPDVAFRRIPLGYASFALLVGLLVWLAVRLGIAGARPGAMLGLTLGGTIWGSLALGLASIATARPLLLVSWFVGQTIELGLAGAIVGAALGGLPVRRLALRAVAVFVVCVVLGIVLQNVVWHGAASSQRTEPTSLVSPGAIGP